MFYKEILGDIIGDTKFFIVTSYPQINIDQCH